MIIDAKLPGLIREWRHHLHQFPETAFAETQQAMKDTYFRRYGGQ